LVDDAIFVPEYVAPRRHYVYSPFVEAIVPPKPVVNNNEFLGKPPSTRSPTLNFDQPFPFQRRWCRGRSTQRRNWHGRGKPATFLAGYGRLLGNRAQELVK
jgi:hypothetical protein